MKVEELSIKGVFLIKPNVFNDNRGYLYESYNSNRWSSLNFPNEFVQDNVAYNSKKNTIRGMHYQEKYYQAKLVSCIRGSITDVVVDIRKDSDTFKQWLSINLSDTNNHQLWIPKGFAHGYRTLEDNTIVYYKTDQYYMPEDYRGFIWNDKNININWGDNLPDDITLSDKDKEYIEFKDE
jgi:dTDP-4-dehydrorhamnose 3,5-epimerase